MMEGSEGNGRTPGQRRDESADGQGPDWKLGKVTERWRTGLPPSGANDGGRWLGVGRYHTVTIRAICYQKYQQSR